MCKNAVCFSEPCSLCPADLLPHRPDVLCRQVRGDRGRWQAVRHKGKHCRLICFRHPVVLPFCGDAIQADRARDRNLCCLCGGSPVLVQMLKHNAHAADVEVVIVPLQSCPANVACNGNACCSAAASCGPGRNSVCCAGTGVCKLYTNGGVACCPAAQTCSSVRSSHPSGNSDLLGRLSRQPCQLCLLAQDGVGWLFVQDMVKSIISEH